jgi:GNAT superfamily N-acetyltransferase
MLDHPDKTVFTRISADSGDIPAIDIRRYAPGDGNRALSVMKRVYIDELGWRSAFLRESVKSLKGMLQTHDPARELFLLAEADVVPVGVMFLKRKSERTAFLRWLTITRDARNRGLGKALLECAVGFSRDVGYDAIDLVTVDRLEQAREFYRRQGFIETARRRDTVWEMDMELCFLTRDLRGEPGPY